MNEPRSAEPVGPSPAARRRVDLLALTLGGILFSAIAVNGVMFWVAERHPPHLVNQPSPAAARDASAGVLAPQADWLVLLQPAASSRASLALRVEDGHGHPVAGVSCLATAARPGHAELDQVLAWQEDVALPGTYRLLFANPAPGPWVIILRLSSPGVSLQRTLEWTAP